MFIILLRLTDKRSLAPQHMEAHNQWLAEGFDAGVFLFAGTIQPREGGAILASQTTREALDARLARDPFVEHGVVSVSVFEVAASRAHPQLAALLE